MGQIATGVRSILGHPRVYHLLQILLGAQKGRREFIQDFIRPVPGASYRFTCPNYLFPYEPHFNIPTVYSKKLTEKLFYRRILESKAMPDPAGAWQSLNWIDVLQVRRVARGLAGISATFDLSLLVSTLERVAVDQDFASRRSPAIRSILLLLVRLRLHQIFRFVPAMFQPIMDCRLKKCWLKAKQWPK